MWEQDRDGALQSAHAPTDPLGGPSPPPSFPATARGGRGAGRIRVLPRLPAALHHAAAVALFRSARRHDLVGARGKPAGARAHSRLPASLALVLIVLLTVLGVEVFRPVHQYIAGDGGARHAAAVAVVLPDTVILLFGLLSLVFLVGVRALARSVYERRPLAAFRTPRRNQRTVLIAGAGEGGRLVAREMMRNRELGLVAGGVLADEPAKGRMRIEGLRVRGNTEGALPRILDEAEPDEVIIAIPSAPGSTRARIVRECRARSIPVRTLPTV